MRHPVTLEILLAPSDMGHAPTLIPHQMRTFADQVDEVVFTLDTTPPGGGRYLDGWRRNLPALEALLDAQRDVHPDVKVARVSDDPAFLQRLGDRFFDGQTIPSKEARGSAFASYWAAFDAPRNDRILHMDSDMLFGGQSQQWVAEALAVLDAEPDCWHVSPLSGPPHPEGRMFGHPEIEPYEHPTPAWRINGWNGRVALLDRARMMDRMGPFRVEPPLYLRRRVKAWVNRNPRVRAPEHILYTRMREEGLFRVDLLGSGAGCWSLHPVLKPPAFYDGLPELVERVERDDLPPGQRGVYDIVDEVVDQRRERRARALRPWR